MNTPVSPELAYLLKDKGNINIWSEYRYTDFNGIERLEKNASEIFPYAPTVAEAVMWLCEEYGIWTVVNVNIMGSWYFEHFDLKEKRNAQFKPTDTHYDSLTEAYEAAITYCLNNLI
jgi:hypothetical protein